METMQKTVILFDKHTHLTINPESPPYIKSSKWELQLTRELWPWSDVILMLKMIFLGIRQLCVRLCICRVRSSELRRINVLIAPDTAVHCTAGRDRSHRIWSKPSLRSGSDYWLLTLFHLHLIFNRTFWEISYIQ